MSRALWLVKAVHTEYVFQRVLGQACLLRTMLADASHPQMALCDSQLTHRTSSLTATPIWRPACLAGSRASRPAWQSASLEMQA